MEYFKKLLDLLKIERQEDLDSYLRLTASASVADRRENGLTWYPIAIRGSETGRGDYLTVEVERTTHHDISHQLRFGASAILFSNHDPKNDRVEGTITHQSGNKLKITLLTEELPDWASDGKLGIDLLFDDNSYNEMQNALKQAQKPKEKAADSVLTDVLTGQKAPTFDTSLTNIVIPKLNPVQQKAVNKILQAQELAIVHGPPGTGKTTTLVQAIKALIAKDGQKVLVVAPSNTAVDLLSEKLAEEGLNVLRVGNPARVSERLASLTMDSKVAEHSATKDLRSLKKQANEYKNMAHKYKRNFGRAEQQQRKALFNEAHKIMKEVNNAEQYIIDDVVAKAQVITATLIGANHYTVREVRYKTVVIDEAGQALEPACWVPILKAEKVVLAGDHCQLPPTIKSTQAAKDGLSNTLMEKCTVMHPEAVVLLEEQYRMNRQIMGYPSSVFYNNKLTAHPNVAGRLLFAEESPLEFIDTAGCGFDEKLEGTSTTNPEEAVFLLKHLTHLVAKLNDHSTVAGFPTIAIISPYKQQIAILNDLITGSEELMVYRSKISINTIDSFQGQERDIVYIGLTRSNTDGAIGFLADTRRMNVAMTRARKKLVVIGDSATLSRSAFYSDFISYAEQCNAYISAWEFVGF
ncbi:AAA domain-containing protein [Pedobacter sp. V48]|uniref:AAA domain-containing protein n=1 Tax=Pedobacter sp. V48 TaxID=509635 RepID=UPI0003E49621|nr:AAA domain-containing protein [Pedobacter sp. V48]ETZ22507.1 hypothetical protein N824_23195 [Pedobacter sp. V48]